MARILWLAGIRCFRNFAMAAYALIQIFRLPEGASAKDLLLRRGAL